MMLLSSGPLPLQVLDAAGAVVKTLWLPAPSRDGLSLEWVEKVVTHELENGSERTKTRGYLPQLTVSWSVYNEATGRTIGVANGCTPTWEQLLDLLATARVRIGTGPDTAQGLTVGKASVSGFGLVGRNWSAKTKITFRGADVRPSRTLEAM